MSRDLSLESCGITRANYRELKNFCLQYPEWKKKLRYDAAGPAGSGSGCNGTEAQALSNRHYLDKMQMVEETAKEADPQLAPYILKNVTSGLAYDYLNVPAGINQFYAARRKFFYLLSKKR